MSKKTIVIIGLGLMGGSLALALKRKPKSFRVFGVSRSQVKIRQAIRNRIIDEGSTHVRDIPRDAFLVCVATPVSGIARIVKELDKRVAATILVTDVGSVKEPIHRELASYGLKHVEFVGSHPMCGDHHTGLAAARNTLYEGSLVFVTRDSGSKTSIQKVAGFWRQAGAGKIVFLRAARHDEIVGEISHLPHLISSLLVLCASPENVKLAGPGFRDATRIAQGDPELWVDIVVGNPYLVSSLKKFEKAVRDLQGVLNTKNWKKLGQLLAAASSRRKSLGSNFHSVPQ
ncbi:MAG: prephenate dehydrogenase/arogenate dehydrogenase family protein [Candidatus Omnitrophica bacterium]|nr:prephenate dehydrogenase/arogenate dehydrogenase family protein [Candidatus Omnitrophota bacterium]